jgi:hypothetical protein
MGFGAGMSAGCEGAAHRAFYRAGVARCGVLGGGPVSGSFYFISYASREGKPSDRSPF